MKEKKKRKRDGSTKAKERKKRDGRKEKVRFEQKKDSFDES